MKKSLLSWSVWMGSILIGSSVLMAEVITPEPGNKDRKAIMDTLRDLPDAQDLAAGAGEKIVFKVQKLLLEDDIALADVIPCSEDLKRSYPGLMVFLRRGGDEPWAVVESGNSADARKSVDGWVKSFLASDAGADFLGLWAAYQPDETSTTNGNVILLQRGSDDREAILKVIHAFDIIKEMGKDLGKDIIFGEVTIKKSGNWAWFEGNPRTSDRSWQGEPITQLLRLQKDQWKAITGIPEEVITADDSDAAYTKWRKGLLKKYSDLTPELVPVQ